MEKGGIVKCFKCHRNDIAVKRGSKGFCRRCDPYDNLRSLREQNRQYRVRISRLKTLIRQVRDKNDPAYEKMYRVIIYNSLGVDFHADTKDSE